ncbi:MAG: cupin domain-containing protein [Candidatus Omnitrophica bacterium]|nr:cupin domain-containing protein [Candidatus Omnitrophota bacterium]
MEKSRPDDIRGRVLNVTELVGYRKSSIVSRILLKKESGNVTMFSFDKGEALSEHTAPFDAMVMVVDGEAEITIAKKSRKVRKGELIIMPANVPHAVKAVKKFKMSLVMLKK